MTDKDENTPAEGEEELPEEATAEDAESGSAEDTIAAESAGDDAEDSEAAGESAEAVEFKELASGRDGPGEGDLEAHHIASELEPVFDVPVNVQAILGKSNIEVSQLLKLGAGSVVELDRKVGEAIDIYVNDRLVARGEVVLVEDHLGVTMTEIIKTDNA